MNTLDLLQDLLYLDRDFISSYYEVVTGEAATTHFTHQEGKKAGAAIPIFSAELSAVEIKSYNVSSLQMLSRVLDQLGTFAVLDLPRLAGKKQTAYGWINGRLSAAVTKSTRHTSKGEEKILAEDRYFTLHATEEPSLALITSESNFQSGINALTRLQSTILKDFSLHVRAFVRVLPSSTHIGHLVAVPLVILEGTGTEN
ncbi:hypothetical protein [Acidovorax sp.]|uniref:hypothetical protein n=1 Tax=Acidovorax sp. TaxID=1872122 RepID=UPI003D041495